MSKFSKKVLVNEDNEPAGLIPKPSETCSNFGCKNNTSIVFSVTRRITDGKTVVGNNMEHRNGVYMAQPGHTFKAWLTRCCQCYDTELRRLERDSISQARKTVEIKQGNEIRPKQSAAQDQSVPESANHKTPKGHPVRIGEALPGSIGNNKIRTETSMGDEAW